MGWLDIFGGNADPYRVVGPDGQPVNKLPQSTFQATDAVLPQQNYGSTIGQTTANAQQNYAQQGDFINALRAQASGQGPSVAQAMLAQQTDAANRNAASAVASQRGMNPALASKLILDQQAQQQQQAAGQGATLRAQEMLANQGMLGQALQAQGAQNLGMFGAAGGLQQGQMGLALQNHQQTQALNQRTAAENAGLQLGAEGINAQANSQNAQSGSDLLGGIIKAGGSAATAAAGGFAAGGPIPGRAAVPGDSPRNDTVRADLSPGEIVLPRSVAQAEDAPEKAAEFVRQIRRGKSGGPPDFGKVLAKIRELHAMVGA